MFAAMSALVEPTVVGEFPLGCVPLRSPLAPELNISQILIPQNYLVKCNLEDYSFIYQTTVLILTCKLGVTIIIKH